MVGRLAETAACCIWKLPSRVRRNQKNELKVGKGNLQVGDDYYHPLVCHE